jgi:hypothetical protein
MNSLILIVAFLVFGLWTLLCIGVGVRIGLIVGGKPAFPAEPAPVPPPFVPSVSAIMAEWEGLKAKWGGLPGGGDADKITPVSYADDEQLPGEKGEPGVKLGA